VIGKPRTERPVYHAANAYQRSSRSRGIRRKGSLTALALVAAAAVALVTWLVTRDDGDESSLDGLAGVERVAGDTVYLSAGATPAEVRKVIADARDVGETRIVLGHVTLSSEAADARGADADVLVALGGVDVPGSIEVDASGSLHGVRIQLDRGATPNRAVRAAGDVVRRSPPGLGTVLVESADSTVLHPVSLTSVSAAPRARLLGGLRRAAAVDGLQAVDGDQGRLNVTVRAPDGDARSAWERAARTLRARRLNLWVGGPEVTVTGPPRPVPDRALRLADHLRAAGVTAHLTSDLTAVNAQAGSVASAAHAAHRLSGALPSSTNVRIAWNGSEGGVLAGSLGTVTAVAPAIARLAGRYAVGWDESNPSVPANLVVRPRRLPRSLFGHRGKLRALVRDIRSIDWPGVARFEVIMGDPAVQRTTKEGKIVRLNCGAHSVVTITSTSNGRARSVRGKCTASGDLSVARAAWNASAG
jgi:hypothetical protein